MVTGFVLFLSQEQTLQPIENNFRQISGKPIVHYVNLLPVPLWTSIFYQTMIAGRFSRFYLLSKVMSEPWQPS
ncbi:MAG: hypothetical protein KAS74_00900 [Methanosarcinales archaeon]|nr:hypothetical protein [Methanosarcinales archaeon]